MSLFRAFAVLGGGYTETVPWSQSLVVEAREGARRSASAVTG